MLLWVGFTSRNGKKLITVNETAFIRLLFAAFGVNCTAKVLSVCSHVQMK